MVCANARLNCIRVGCLHRLPLLLEITKAVVYAAFSMAPTGDGHYWTVGTDYRAVDELYRSLRLGPYEWMRNWTFSRVWDEYGNLIIAFLVFLLAWIAHSVRVTRLVTVRTQELRDALEREKELKAQANETHERIERLQKAVLSVSFLR